MTFTLAMNTIGTATRIIDTWTSCRENTCIVVVRLVAEPLPTLSMLTTIKTLIGIGDGVSIDKATTDTNSGGEAIGKGAIPGSVETIVALGLVIVVAIHEEKAKLIRFIPSEVRAELIQLALIVAVLVVLGWREADEGSADAFSGIRT